MIKEINYKGVTETPSDYVCPDGELSVSMNAIADGQGVKPIIPPRIKTRFKGKDVQIAYMHKTSRFEHYIFSGDGNLSWSEVKAEIEGGDFHELSPVGSGKEVELITSIGNTLLVSTTGGTYYYLWKDEKYTLLGKHLPELGMEFGLVGEWVQYKDSHTYRDDESIWDTLSNFNVSLSEGTQKAFTEEVMAVVNKLIAKEGTEKERFVMPFFVRYAYRLYDGSLTMHSAPILMTPTLTDAPLAYITRIWQDGGRNHLHFYYNVGAYACDLHACVEEVAKERLMGWEDIVRSVDIFVSPPLYTHDQSGKIKTFGILDEKRINFIGCKKDSRYGTDILTGALLEKMVRPDEMLLYDGFSCFPQYEEITTIDFYNKEGRVTMHDDNGSHNPWKGIYHFVLPETDFKEKVLRNSQFFLISSIPIKELPTPIGSGELAEIIRKEKERQKEQGGAFKKPFNIPNPFQKVNLRKGTLSSLVNREAMSDDYDSHDNVWGKCMYVYNSRLNMANISKEAFRGFPLKHCTQHTSGRIISEANYVITGEHTEPDPDHPGEDMIVQDGEWTTETKLSGFDALKVEYYARKDGREVVYSGFIYQEFAVAMPILFLYHTDPDVYGAKIIRRVGHFDRAYDLPMRRHDFLNGSFAFTMEKSNVNEFKPNATDTTPFVLHFPSKVYTSEVNNPFFFPVRNINTIGTGEIRGLSSSTKAISTGQFGQFPMYALTSEGVWALEVSATGGFSAKQPVTRDVCNNPSSITQLDNAVMFTSDRGIMLMSGGDSTCISQVLDNPNPFSLSSLPNADKLPSVGWIGKDAFKSMPFKEYLKGARFAFDYVGQRIVVFNPSTRFAYMFSMDSKSWGMTPCDWHTAVNCYPSVLVQSSTGDIYDLTQEDLDYVERDDDIRALLVTRPLKLDDADALKTIDTIIQRGKFLRQDMSSILYGSRDLYKWFPVWSSKDMYMRGFRGTPYKYYRLVIGCLLENDSRISGCTIQYSARQGNQPR